MIVGAEKFKIWAGRLSFLDKFFAERLASKKADADLLSDECLPENPCPKKKADKKIDKYESEGSDLKQDRCNGMLAFLFILLTLFLLFFAASLCGNKFLAIPPAMILAAVFCTKFSIFSRFKHCKSGHNYISPITFQI